jgi:hypothetical protein
MEEEVPWVFGHGQPLSEETTWLWNSDQSNQPSCIKNNDRLVLGFCPYPGTYLIVPPLIWFGLLGFGKFPAHNLDNVAMSDAASLVLGSGQDRWLQLSDSGLCLL